MSSANAHWVHTDPIGLDAIVDAVRATGRDSIEHAETLPPIAYTSKAFFDLEVERLFKKDWICVGHISQVPNVGDYFTIDLFGELLVVVRGPDRVRVMSRVCLHRWAPVATGAGNTKLFSCPFHKWGYGLDGQLLGAPFMERAEGFEPKSCGLPEIRSEIVEPLGMIFITFSETVLPIGERLGEMAERLKNWRMNELVAVWPTSTDGDFNWKIQIETGMECYHHFAAHPGTFEVNYPTKLSWCEEAREAWSLCHSPPRADLADEDLTIGLPILPDLTPAERRSFDLYYIFPLTRLIVFTDRIVLRTLQPISPTKTLSTAISLVRPEVAADPDLIHEKFTADDEFRNQAGKEDNDIDVMQQLGAGSSLTRSGRLSHLEAGVWHLAQYVRSRIGAN